MTQRLPYLNQEVADAARDVLALVRTELNGDREGEKAILDTLDLDRAKLLLAMTASLTAMTIRHSNGSQAEELLTYFAQEYLT